MQKFSDSTRHARRVYSRRLKNDYLSDRLALNEDSTAADVSQQEVEDEAFDSYFATKMDAFDKDFEVKRANVLSTLRIGLIDPRYSDSSSTVEAHRIELMRAAQSRFRSLWSALQRVYFHELEDDQQGNPFSIDHDFDAATDPELSNLWTTVRNATLDAEINEWFASLQGRLPSSAIEPRGGKRGVEIANRLTERISKINKTLFQLNQSSSVAPFHAFTVFLVFPGREISDRFFTVTHDIDVEIFHQQLRALFGQPTTHVFVFLGPEWVKFDRPGSVISRFLPDGITPCPFPSRRFDSSGEFLFFSLSRTRI